MNLSISGALISIYSLLTVLTSVFAIVRWVKGPGKLITELIERTLSWWAMITVAAICLFLNDLVATLSLMTLSIFAFREIIGNYNLAEDHKKVLRICYCAIPIQYLLAYYNETSLFLTFIPVMMFLALSLRSVVSGTTENISRTMGVLHWSLMMTVFSFSHIALLYSHNLPLADQNQKYHLVLFLILATEINDVFQFTWGKLLGKTKVCPEISPKKTLEGLVGGVLSTTALSYTLAGFIGTTGTQAMILGALIATTGFFGDITFSAIKRDLNIKDLGNSIPGHGGLLDRVDSLALTSIVFFYAFKYLI
ncbi:phosphatidate cytidylyltransferase [Bdellovibrio svalbardensis]|uniref:Phosphatidate cytidylyltransferase n=1 Tax=Bdellovibrio svalbardensis TaxID=2972972 RepID=A0ABT6DEZ4_9BACT|nr:phosphatidate cytidylyltransferase [Bdellovibrio svalbardensis]MDG0815411.1 phosphatidate cytidylyltransferase [Bdellovibrio svalbardensis]